MTNTVTPRLLSFILITTATIAVYAAIANGRNHVWRTQVSLWADASKKSPGKARPHYNYATVLTDEGRLDEAFMENIEVIKIDPSHAKAAFSIAAHAHVKGDLKEAEDLYRLSLELNPAIYQAYNNLGYIYLTTGRAQDSLALFNTAIELHPDYLNALINKGNALKTLKRYRESLEPFSLALRLKPDSEDAKLSAAEALDAMDRNDDAIALIQQVAASNPSNQRAQIALKTLRKKKPR